MITVNHITIANKSWWTPYLRANAVARDTTTEEWTEGIPPLQNDLSTSHFPDTHLINIPLKNTDNAKAVAGTRMIVS